MITLGFRVYRVSGLGLWGLGVRLRGLGFRGSGFRAWGVGPETPKPST